MKSTKYTWILITTAALVVCALLAWYEVYFDRSENAAFAADLSSFSQDAQGLASINGFTIENEGNGSYRINGFVADPDSGQYYTDRPVPLAQFASSTDMTIAQENALINVMQKYRYIGRIVGDVNVAGTCAGQQGSASYPCTAIEIYLQQSLPALWFDELYSSGYMYAPFGLSASDQSYLHRYFTELKEVGAHWYSFSGQHL